MTQEHGEDVTLTRAEMEKDLGVTVDTSLGFDDHVAAAVKKGNQNAGVIRRSFTHLPPKTFSQLFRALVRPHLEYAHAVWQPYTRMHICHRESAKTSYQTGTGSTRPGIPEEAEKTRTTNTGIQTSPRRHDRGLQDAAQHL